MLSKQYRKQLEEMHRDTNLKWGNDGGHHLEAVLKLIRHIDANTLLDFGCGRSKLSKALKNYGSPVKCTDYDPGRPKKAVLPNAVFDIVTCTDVMEHVEPEHVDEVLDAIAKRAGKAAYFVIDTIPALRTLPDGRNAHLTVQPAQWWLDKLNRCFPVHLWFGLQSSTPKKLTVEFWIRA